MGLLIEEFPGGSARCIITPRGTRHFHFEESTALITELPLLIGASRRLLPLSAKNSV